MGGVSTIVTASTTSCLCDSEFGKKSQLFTDTWTQHTYWSQVCSFHELYESCLLCSPCKQSSGKVWKGHLWGKSSPFHGAFCSACVARTLKNRVAEQRTFCETEQKHELRYWRNYQERFFRYNSPYSLNRKRPRKRVHVGEQFIEHAHTFNPFGALKEERNTVRSLVWLKGAMIMNEFLAWMRLTRMIL